MQETSWRDLESLDVRRLQEEHDDEPMDLGVFYGILLYITQMVVEVKSSAPEKIQTSTPSFHMLVEGLKREPRINCINNI